MRLGQMGALTAVAVTLSIFALTIALADDCGKPAETNKITVVADSAALVVPGTILCSIDEGLL